MATTLNITIVGNLLKIENVHASTGLVTPDQFIRGENITKIGGIFSKVSHGDMYADPNTGEARTVKTIVVIQLSDNTEFRFEAQDVANQGAWSGGTIGTLNAAITAITAAM